MANIATKFGLSSGGPIYGAPHIGYDTGLAYHPHYMLVGVGAGLTTTSTRAYYMPFFVAEAVTFSSIKTVNTGAGDNGDTYRVAIYANDGTAGPGTLILDAGQVTLTGASAVRTLSVSIDLTAYGGSWVWVMVHCNQAASMGEMTAVAATVGAQNMVASFGGFDFSVAAYDYNKFVRYVDTAYGAAASTAVAPTASTATGILFAFVK